MSEYINTKEAAQHLAVHPSTVRRMIGRGKLQAVKIGQAYQIAMPYTSCRSFDRSAVLEYHELLEIALALGKLPELRYQILLQSKLLLSQMRYGSLLHEIRAAAEVLSLKNRLDNLDDLPF